MSVMNNTQILQVEQTLATHKLFKNFHLPFKPVILLTEVFIYLKVFGCSYYWLNYDTSYDTYRETKIIVEEVISTMKHITTLYMPQDNINNSRNLAAFCMFRW